MTEVCVERWNSVVTPHDTVFHLGDFALSWGKQHKPVIDELLSRLQGVKFLIKGNHDRKEVTKNPRWSSVEDYHEIKIDLGGVHKQRIVLCHYAIKSWNQMHRGAWMLHGHSHGNLMKQPGKILDVGVDCHHFTPISLDQVWTIMETKEMAYVDHHAPDGEDLAQDFT